MTDDIELKKTDTQVSIPAIDGDFARKPLFIGLVICVPIIIALMLRSYLVSHLPPDVITTGGSSGAVIMSASGVGAVQDTNSESKLSTDGLNTIQTGTALPAFQNAQLP